MEKTFPVQVDEKGYDHKPSGPEIGTIKKRVQTQPETMCTIEEFCKFLEEGRTVSPGILSGGLGAKNWVYQQLFMVDIDNAIENVPHLSEEDILEQCRLAELKPNFIIQTFSSTEPHMKFRVGFLHEDIIEDPFIRELIMEHLTIIFPQSDVSCKNADRIFFGTDKKVTYIDPDATFLYEEVFDVVAREWEKCLESEEKEYTNLLPNTGSDSPDLKTEIRNFDLLSYMESECGSIKRKSSKYAMFDYCPLCDGHDDLVYYYDNNTFTCFGKYGRKTGNIITWLMMTKNISKKEAVEYFLYDMLGYEKPTKKQKHVDVSNISKNIKKEVQQLYDILLSLDRPVTEYSQDDIGMSDLFAATVKDFLRYNTTRKLWMKYNGKVWINDVGSSCVNQYVKYFTDALLQYTLNDDFFSDVTDQSFRQKQIEQYRRFIVKFGSKGKRDTIVKDAQSVFSIQNKELDKNTDLFNCQNGTLNLKTLEFKEHTPDDLLSKISRVNYNPEASQETFKKFVSEIMENDEDKINFLQRVMGYSLTSNISEECMFILYGPTTRNGKSTFVESYMYMMGDYALNSTPETLAIKTFADSRKASGDIARLKDVRFVNMSELPIGMVLNVALVKTLTGGDTVTAREIYQSEFEFRPQFKLFMNTNYLPQVDDNTLFKSGRVNIISFDRHFSPEEQDKTLKRKLRQDDVLSGVLNWCLDGLKEYMKQGLNIPKCVSDANISFQEDSDLIKLFLSDCFYQSLDYTKAKDVYYAYCKWCGEIGYNPDKKRIFLEKLRKEGLLGTKNGLRNALLNYSLNPDYREPIVVF